MDAVLEKYQFEYFCIDNRSSLRLYLDLKGYPVVETGNGYRLYQTSDLS